MMKRTLRRSMRAALRAVPLEIRHRWSQAACRRLTELPEWQSAGCVSVFLAMLNELDSTPLVEVAWRNGAQVVVPRVVPDQPGIMDSVSIRSWSDCLPGFKGILEPVSGDPVDVESIDLVVVPGVAFDASGARLGQGGGYYDRFLSRPGLRATICGIAFEAQFVEAVPVDPHDHGVDMLVTEADVRRFSTGG